MKSIKNRLRKNEKTFKFMIGNENSINFQCLESNGRELINKSNGGGPVFLFEIEKVVRKLSQEKGFSGTFLERRTMHGVRLSKNRCRN